MTKQQKIEFAKLTEQHMVELREESRRTANRVKASRRTVEYLGQIQTMANELH